MHEIGYVTGWVTSPVWPSWSCVTQHGACNTSIAVSIPAGGHPYKNESTHINGTYLYIYIYILDIPIDSLGQQIHYFYFFVDWIKRKDIENSRGLYLNPCFSSIYVFQRQRSRPLDHPKPQPRNILFITWYYRPLLGINNTLLIRLNQMQSSLFKILDSMLDYIIQYKMTVAWQAWLLGDTGTTL